MTEPDKPDIKPEDVDALVKNFGQPLEPARKQELMDKLRKENKRLKEAPSQNTDERDKGHSR